MTFKKISVWKSVLSEDICSDVETQTEITIIDREVGNCYISLFILHLATLNTQFHSFHSKGC